MIACTSPEETFRSTPLTIWVPSSSETCKCFSSSVATVRNSSGLANKRFCSSVRDAHRSQADPDHRSPYEPAAQPQRGPERALPRLLREAAAGALVAGERREEVVGRPDRLRLLGVLALPPVPAQHEVARPRRELLPPEELLGAPRDRQLADRVLEGVDHRLGVRLRLVDRRHRLRLPAEILA